MTSSVLEISVPNVPVGESPRTGYVGFLAGDENRVTAESIARLIRDAENIRGGGRLLLVGGSGLGKSHLLRGVAWKWAQCHVDADVVCTTAGDLIHDFSDALERREAPKFRRRLHAADFFLLDDLHQLSGRSAVQRELRLLLDVYDNLGKPTLLASKLHPAMLTGFDPGLRARLLAGVVLTLTPPAAATRAALVSRLAAADKIALRQADLQSIAEATNSAEEVRRAVQMITAGETSTLAPSVDQESLAKRTPTLAEIVKRTAEEFQAPVAEIQGKSRRKSIVLARHVACYLARSCTKHSLGNIGATLGGRDHTTVMHSVRTIEQRLSEDLALRRRVEAICDALRVDMRSRARKPV